MIVVYGKLTLNGLQFFGILFLYAFELCLLKLALADELFFVVLGEEGVLPLLIPEHLCTSHKQGILLYGLLCLQLLVVVLLT